MNIHINNMLIIGFRTTVAQTHAGIIIEKYNDIMREISRNRSINLYDFDKEAWSSINYNKTKESTIFMDRMHPRPFYRYYL